MSKNFKKDTLLFNFCWIVSEKSKSLCSLGIVLKILKPLFIELTEFATRSSVSKALKQRVKGNQGGLGGALTYVLQTSP